MKFFWSAKKNILFIIFLFLLLVVFLLFYFRPGIFADLSFPSKGYVMFSKSSFDYVLSSTEPEKNEVIPTGGALSIFAAKGEIEPLTFSVRSNYDLGESRVEVSDLESLYDSSYISKDNIELYNVKLWQQCKGDRKHCDTDPQAVEVPELLVKDNEQDLIAAEQGWVDGEYHPPSLNSDFRVNIKANQTHTFYLRIKVPRDINAGTYTGTIKFLPQNGKEDFFQLKLEVLPFILPKPDKEFLVYFNQEIGKGLERKLSSEMYAKYLDVFRESGITSILSYDPSSAGLITGMMKEKGFRGAFIQLKLRSYSPEHIKELAQVIRSNGFSPYFYTYDEPHQTAARMKSHMSRLKAIHDAGEKGTTAGLVECAQAILDPEFPLFQDLADEGVLPPQQLDLGIYAASSEKESRGCRKYGIEKYQSFYSYIKNLREGKTEKVSPKEFYYFQIWTEDAAQNRVKAGFFLHNSGLEGVAAYGVQSYYQNKQGPKQYDDFDAPRKTVSSLYPSQQGPVLTLQWEAFREGIDDYRYLEQYTQLLEKIKNKDLNLYQNLKKEMEEKLSVYQFYGANGEQPWVLPDSFHQATRAYIKDKILLVNETLTTPIPLPAPVDQLPPTPSTDDLPQEQENKKRSDDSSSVSQSVDQKDNTESTSEGLDDLSFLAPNKSVDQGPGGGQEVEEQTDTSDQINEDKNEESLGYQPQDSSREQSADTRLDAEYKTGSDLEAIESKEQDTGSTDRYWFLFIAIVLISIVVISLGLWWWLKEQRNLKG